MNSLEKLELTISFLKELEERFSTDGCNELGMLNTEFNRSLATVEGEGFFLMIDEGKHILTQNGYVISNLISILESDAEYLKTFMQ
jgi:hypothetical protein